MPELPEVETTRRGIRDALIGRRVDALVVREPRLRWRIEDDLPARLAGRVVRDVRRRAKYLLLDVDDGTLILHLGMSGSLRVLEPSVGLLPHDHYDLAIDGGRVLRFNDPRRFGSLLWADDASRHPLLKGLGPEPLDDAFDAEYLASRARGRKVAIKPFLMDQRIVVGVGNIYASEALYRAGIRPKRAAGRVARPRFPGLVRAVRDVLNAAIRKGGTTLRDYVGADGNPGYFRQRLHVYERTGEPCRRCGTPIRQIVQGNRSTYFCPSCQT